MVITKEYLLNNRTKKGGFTKAQLKALDIKWPPRQGWMDILIGSEISEEMRSKFEISKQILIRPNKKKPDDHNAIERKLIELIDYIESLENRINAIEQRI